MDIMSTGIIFSIGRIAELSSCVKEDVDVLGCQTLIVLMVSADVMQH